MLVWGKKTSRAVIHHVIKTGERVQVQSMFGANNLKVCADIHAVEIHPRGNAAGQFHTDEIMLLILRHCI